MSNPAQDVEEIARRLDEMAPAPPTDPNGIWHAQSLVWTLDVRALLAERTEVSKLKERVQELEGERDYAVERMKEAQEYWKIETWHAEAAEATVERMRKALEEIAAIDVNPIVKLLNEDGITYRSAEGPSATIARAALADPATPRDGGT